MGVSAKAFIRRHLEPADRLAESLCGLIMVLTFTLVAAPQMGQGPKGVRALAFATVGCNVAWGIIDGVLYVLCAMAQRARKARLGMAIRKAPGREAGIEIVREQMEPTLGGVAAQEDRDKLYGAIFQVVSDAELVRTKVRLEDLLGGLAILLVEIACTIPAVVPFLLIPDKMVALRVSNAVLLVLLYLVGHEWAATINASRVGAGLIMLLLGGALVSVAVALGG